MARKKKQNSELPLEQVPGGAAAPISARELDEALKENFLAFALATITDRALPDVRDGLKPVQRRLLYAMNQLRLRPGAPFKKSARIVGDVIGKYHPHGDQAAYDALVRLAQWFSTRYRLVDGQGNFGNIDGDGPAAMRYTEARLTEVAAMLLEGLDEDAVDLRPTFTSEDQEPDVLPAAFPNLLANGAIGIAVGMATSIPPHNVVELCRALLHLIKAPKARIDTLTESILGPDFPTGGVLVEPLQSMQEAYKEGKGSFRLRANWTKEKGPKRGQYTIVIDEIPYQVQKSRLIERLADLVITRKVPLLADVRDESGEDIRIVLEPRSGQVDAEVLMEILFKQTDLEVRVPLNLNVLLDGHTPDVVSLRDALQAFLDHRRDVLQRRTKHRLERIRKRLEILGGYMIAYLNLDRVIEIIRFDDTPKETMMAEFKLTEVQADAILDMRLRNLRKLEEQELRTEEKSLKDEQKKLRALAKSEKDQWKVIAGEIRELQKLASQQPEWRRKTKIDEAPEVEDVPLEAMIEKEPVTVICSKLGWIRAMRGHLAEDAEVRYKDGDGPAFRFLAETTDKIMLFGSNGRMYTLPCDRLPGGRSMGDPVRHMIELAGEDKIVALFPYQPEMKLLVASNDGRGLIVPLEAQLTTPGRRAGKKTLSVKAPARAVACAPVEGDSVAAVNSARRMIVFPLSELPEQNVGRGVILQKPQKSKDATLSDATVFDSKHGLSWFDSGGRTRTEEDLTDWQGKRSAVGRLVPRGFPSDRRFNKNRLGVAPANGGKKSE